MLGQFKRLVKKIKKDKTLIVLLYHKITATGVEVSDGLSVSAQNYLEQISYLKSKYKIFASIDEWRESNESGILITFDDGYYNNLAIALPVHKKLNIPLTLFNTTYWLDKDKLFWWEIVALNSKNRDDLDKITLTQKLMKLKTIDEKEALMSSLKFDEDCSDDNRSMNREEFIQFASHPLVTIGSHTLNHPRLSNLNESEQTKEIVKSKKELESLVSRPISLFSYPHGGKAAFNDISKQIVKSAGYVYAFAAYSGVVKKDFDPYEIPRVHVSNISASALADKLRRL